MTICRTDLPRQKFEKSQLDFVEMKSIKKEMYSNVHSET
jgi:hypothetical protein